MITLIKNMIGMIKIHSLLITLIIRGSVMAKTPMRLNNPTEVVNSIYYLL